MSKILTVWGGGHCGKTTFAVSLAFALANRGLLVGLVSSNLIYGELQTFFGQAVPREKGLFAALRGENPNPGELFTSSGENKNLFFLSVPTRYTGLLFEAVTLEKAETLLNNAALMFDVLIVDGSAQLANPVSGVGLWLADTVLTLHRPSVAAWLWQTGVTVFVRELHLAEKQTHILLSPNGSFDEKTYRDMTKLAFAGELPYVRRAAELENAGTPLYLYRDRECRRYRRTLDKLAGTLIGGESS
ncbi:MAG: cobalamin biosynthesis protein CobQ [Bacillota bacterium]|uniref:CobQ/CobB/MinD/ParA nucleotide binding domain protein n=1 Tax=Oxobacter pfennigii TaxID=36849 RepID=A0A0P8W8S8_9CLOT|nr:cobalamin biosynthesis protein CobQ [Oxobacter pfennigii]KPU45076.1 CobQ/CobB/MinD/ParA nucleotide binding domain protein [Oxobacter pfennigii]